MFDEQLQNNGFFDRFGLRAVVCRSCERPYVMLAMGVDERDLSIQSLRKLAPTLRLPSYALILRDTGATALVRKLWPDIGEYTLTARQWQIVLDQLVERHRCGR